MEDEMIINSNRRDNQYNSIYKINSVKNDCKCAHNINAIKSTHAFLKYQAYANDSIIRCYRQHN